MSEIRFAGRGGSTIRLGASDCIRGMESWVEPGSVDVVVTSPPYNLGVKYSTYRDSLRREDYLEWTRAWVGGVARVLSPDGSFFLNVGSKPTDPWVPFQVAGVAGEVFKLQNVIHWIKSIAIGKADVGDYPGITCDVAVGHYKPISGPRFVNDCHEYVFHFTRSGKVQLDRLAVGVRYQDSSNAARWKSGRAFGVRCRGNTWFIPYETIRDRTTQRPHPATFPVKLPEMCVKLHGAGRCRLVMDPFLGLGATAVACARLGVSFIGFDLDPHYVQIAAERVRRELSVQSLW